MKKLIPILLLIYFNSFSQQTSTFCSALESSEFNVQKLSIINNPTIIPIVNPVIILFKILNLF